MLQIRASAPSEAGTWLAWLPALSVPVILRGKFQDLPKDIHQDCHYLDYTKQSTQPHFNIGDESRNERATVLRIADTLKASVTN